MAEDPTTNAGPGAQPARVRLDFEVVKDAWQEVRLSDGTLLRLKLVVVDVFREAAPGPGQVAYSVNGQLIAVPDLSGTAGIRKEKKE